MPARQQGRLESVQQGKLVFYTEQSVRALERERAEES
jgi:hypothetical protein